MYKKINNNVDKKHIARLSPQLYCEYHRRYTSSGREDILHGQSKYYPIFPRDLSQISYLYEKMSQNKKGCHN